MTGNVQVPADHRTLRLLDTAVITWAVLWTVLGVWTGVTLWQAADVGDTISSSGRSLTSVGQGLEGLSAVPVIGDRPAEIGGDVSATAADITTRGAEVKGQLRQLAIFLGVAVVGIPVTPILGLYVPARIRRARDVTRIRRLLGERAGDPRLERYLADRARAKLPFHTLVALESGETSDDPEDVRRLAAAELARLGIARTAATRPSPANEG